MKISLLLDYRDQVLGLEQDLYVTIVGHHLIYLSNVLLLLSRGFQRLYCTYVDHNITNGAKGSQAISNVVSNVTAVDDDTNISKLMVDPHLNSNNGEINNVIDSVIVQMHGITSSFSTGNI